MEKITIKKLQNNWKAGLSVAMINIPLSISLAVASWATPMQWLLTWIWWWIFASIFASSKFNIFWVAWALSWILLTFAMKNGAQFLPFIAIMSWLIMLLIYTFKITKYITLIPTTALHWFMAWVGITIAAWQLNNALWITWLKAAEKVYSWVWQTFMHINDMRLSSFLMFAIWFAFLFICKKKFPKFPSVIILTIVWIWLGYLVKKWMILPSDILLLQDKYPSKEVFIPFQNIFAIKDFQDFSDFLDIVRIIFSTSLVIAIIAVLETIISAKIAQKMTKIPFSKDKEVLWLGISNIASWLTWWLPVTAVFVRTALNIDAWANSKTSALLTWVFTLIFSVLFYTNWFLYLPFPIIAAILINIAVWLIDIKHLKKLYDMQHSAFYITLITTFFYILEDATIWILVWTALSLIAYIKRVTDSWAKVSLFRNKKYQDKLDFGKYVHHEQKDWDVILLKFSGWLNYLNQEKNIHHLELIDKKIVIILSFTHMWDLDIDWVETIDEIFLTLKNRWIELYFTWLGWFFQRVISKTKVYKALEKEWKIMNPTSAVLHNLLWDNFQQF